MDVFFALNVDHIVGKGGNMKDYYVIPEEKIPWCCGSCKFIRYKTGKPTCEILSMEICVFGFCDGYVRSDLI